MNCTTIDNPCLTIQYAIDKVTMSNDIIKLDGSFGSFSVPYEIRISRNINITFTSYNGVAWVYTNKKSSLYSNYGTFLILANLLKDVRCEIHINTINFRALTLVQPEDIDTVQFLANITLTVKNCRFEFYKPPPIAVYQTLITVKNQHSFITIDNCTIKASCSLGILYYLTSTTGHRCKKLPSTEITLRNTQIEDAIYTVDANQLECIDAPFEDVSSKLIVVNSMVHSRGTCKRRVPQFDFNARRQPFSKDQLTIHMVNSHFENLSTAMHIQRGSTFISNCTFKSNVGHKAGALHLQSRHITVENSHFYENEAQARDEFAPGRAIFLFVYDTRAKVGIYNSSFINNKAAVGGCSVNMGMTFEVVVSNTHFITRSTSSLSIWFSQSYLLTIDDVSFEAGERSQRVGYLFYASALKTFWSEGMSVFKCPIGSTLHFSDSTGGKFRKTEVACQYCPNGTYTLTQSSMYGFKDTNAKQRRFQRQCQPCSFGAICNRDIEPKPNFWGYVYKNKAFIILCPPGYCCQTSDQCTSLKSCSDRRTGRLCGECKHGYFQSVFTHDCLEEKVCKTGKFWAVAISMCLLFTAMFIFLQDIFFCIVKILNIDSIASMMKNRVHWLGKMLLLTRINGYQIDERNENESYSDREIEEVEGNDESEIDEDNTKPNNNSTASGLIKIVFFFYQTHSLLTVHKSNRETRYLGDLKAIVLSIFNLNAEVPLRNEFHCPLHGMGSITKVWIKALFPLSCLMFAGFLHSCAYALSYVFSNSDIVQKYYTKAKPRLLIAILQLILLGYSTITSSILSLVTCIALVNGERILYIDGNVPCFQTWQYAILVFIVLWAIPLIYSFYKLPSCMRKGEITIQGVYAALLLPLPFAVYIMARGVRKMRHVTSDDRSSNQCETPFIPYVRIKRVSATLLQLLNVIEGPFRYKTIKKKREKLSWEPILLFQRIVLSLCNTFVLQPGIRSSLLLLFIIIFSYMNARYRPFDSGFMNAISGITFIFLWITGIINAIYVFMYEYGSVPYGPLAKLLDIFDYLEATMIMIFPVIALVILVILAVAKFVALFISIVGFLIAKCKRCYCDDH